jgi:murein DD-endopeptidase MepM/ murein hydrolase activator NlpD
MFKRITIGIVLSTILLTFVIAQRAFSSIGKTEQIVSTYQPSNKKISPKLEEMVYEIESGNTFNGILQGVGDVSSDEALSITKEVNEIFDVSKIKAGSFMKFLFINEAFAQVTYDIDDETMIIVEKNEEEVSISEEKIKYELKDAQSETTITSSLYLDGTSIGMSNKAILDLASIFSWDIDFATNIQTGDSFNVIYQNRYRDGEFVGVGDILAARFTNSGVDYYAFLVEQDGVRNYYNEVGESKERLLLKTPLNYSRISSNFSYSRKNPVNGNFASHRAIDLAAPTGTPIESVGGGVVEYAGWNGGYGKYIRIRHGNGFKTAYAHLSNINSKVVKGGIIEQGQLIGAVGSTGNSTGPHLHYELWKEGVPVNPFTTDLPGGEAITEELENVFQRVLSLYIDRL